MRTALVIGGRPDYAGPAVRILPRTGARIYPSGHVYEAEVDDSINNNDQQQQLTCNAAFPSSAAGDGKNVGGMQMQMQTYPRKHKELVCAHSSPLAPKLFLVASIHQKKSEIMQ